MSDELVTWLRAQLDDDERVARVASGWGDLPLGHLSASLEAHLIRWMPARVLAEVDAKRRILDLHAPVVDGTQSSWAWFQGSESQSEAIIRLLALPYADQPGYREEWRP